MLYKLDLEIISYKYRIVADYSDGFAILTGNDKFQMSCDALSLDFCIFWFNSMLYGTSSSFVHLSFTTSLA